MTKALLLLSLLTLCMGTLSVSQMTIIISEYVGCYGRPNDYFSNITSVSGHNEPFCVDFCLNYGYIYSLADRTFRGCQCDNDFDPADLTGTCDTNCIYGPDFPVCGNSNEFALYRSTLVEVPTPPPYDQILVFGGKGKKDTEAVFAGSLPSGDCTAIPDALFVTQNAIALLDNYGRPMICGGTKNPNPKSCVIYDVTTNTWEDGPSMKRQRDGASATCLYDGVCWIFGGKSKEVTEYYDPATHTFVIGPDMPVKSVHGVCTALGPISGLIYMVARREPGKTRAFSFDPQAQTFTPLADIDGVEIRYPACGVVVDPDNPGKEIFVVVGGGPNNGGGTSSVHIFSTASDTWTAGTDYPHQVIGSSTGHLPALGTFTVQGGLTPEGEELSEVFSYVPATGGWCKQLHGLDEGRSFAPSIAIEKACPSGTVAN